MKTVTFQSQQFSVPSWANYITQDIDGYYVWEDMPGFHERERTYYSRSTALCCEVFPLHTDMHVIMKIEY